MPHLAVISDVHGNLGALDACVREAEARRADGFLFLGDMVTDGPRSGEVLQRVRELKSGRFVREVRGNREGYVHAARGRTGGQRLSGVFAAQQHVVDRLTDADWAHIISMPESVTLSLHGCAPLFLIHDQTKAQSCGALALCGHTHSPFVGAGVVNPGSCGLDVAGGALARMAFLTWVSGAWQAELVGLAYDNASVLRDMETVGMMAEGGLWARAVAQCIRTGENACGRFVEEGLRLAKHAGIATQRGVVDVPEAVWEEAARNVLA